MSTTPPFLNQSLPLLGHAIAFKKDRTKLFQKGYDQLGPVFSIRLGPQKAVVLVGPEYAELFFKETDHALDMAKPYRFIRAAFGEVGFLAGPETYALERPLIYAPFTREKMKAYLEVMNDEVQDWLDGLPEEGEMELGHEMNLLVQEIAGSAMMGKDFQKRVGREFWDHYTTIGKSLDPLLPPGLPLPKFLRRNRARKALLKILRPILAERRGNAVSKSDFLQDIVDTKLSDGRPASDEQVLNVLLGLLFAGHETTVGQTTWTIIQLIQHPDYLALVRKELEEKLPPNLKIDQKVFVNLRKLRWAVDETTRLRPSADILIRVADRDLQAGDYRIPKGWPVFLASGVQQRMPALFKDPEAYDPMRYSPDRAEHKCQRHAIPGFGGGIHKCAGMSFALNEMAVITALLFQQFELELLSSDITAKTDLGASRPSEARVRFRRKPKPAKRTTKAEVLPQTACPHLAKALAEKQLEGKHI